MSTEARERILAQIRQALGSHCRPQEERAALERRMHQPAGGPFPPMGEDDLEAFLAKARANLFTVERVASLQMLVPAVRKLLPETREVPDISVAPALKHLGWPADWKVNFGPGRRIEPLSVTLAVAGIAETGSLVLQSGGDSPMTLNFLPDTHVVALRKSDIVRHIEDAWARLGSKDGLGPRTLSIISGPSRTADVGGVVVRPAHGPKSLHLVLVED